MSFPRHGFVANPSYTPWMNTAPALIHHQPTPQNDLRRLKLAVVTETFPPEVNGVAQTISRAIDGLSTNGHQIQLVRPKQDHRIALSPRIQEVLVTGIPIPRYGQLRMGLPAALKLIRLWKSCRPDLIHIVTEGPLGLSALMAGLHLNIPICSEFRTNFHSYCRH